MGKYANTSRCFDQKYELAFANAMWQNRSKYTNRHTTLHLVPSFCFELVE